MRGTSHTHVPPSRSHHLDRADRLELLSAVAALLSAASMAAIALIDASSVADRVAGHHVDARPLWLHAFSISVITLLVAMRSLFHVERTTTRVASIAYVLVAGLNATVPVLGQDETGVRPTIALLHTALALVLIAMCMISWPTRPTRDESSP